MPTNSFEVFCYTLVREDDGKITMFGIHDLTLFVVSGLLLNIMPGPDSLLIIARSATQGWRAGVAAAMGIGSGTMVHVLAAAVGLSAILATSATAFMAVKYLGAAYIIWMAIGLLRSKRKQVAKQVTVPPLPSQGRTIAQGNGDQPCKAGPLRWGAVDLPNSPLHPYCTIFAQGFLTNVLNPKVAVFFLAFVPQFIDAGAPHKALAFIILGCIFNINGMLWCMSLALFTARVTARVNVNPALSLWLNRATGGLFIWLGIKLALSKQS